MFINKIGMEHLESGMNCQDYGFEGDGFSVVCDGCSDGKHSEVGAKLYCYFSKIDCAEWVFDVLTDLFNENKVVGSNMANTFKNFLSFTVLEVMEEDTEFVVNYCGDGYIILQDHDGNIRFEELSDGEYPKYYIYNYIATEYLKHYKDGVSFSKKTYSKEEYAKVGIASDGLRYILQADEELKREFIDCLKSGKELKTKLFINRNHRIFKDDVTIVF